MPRNLTASARTGIPSQSERSACNNSKNAGHYIADKKLCKIVPDKCLIQLFSIHTEHKDKVFLLRGAVKIRYPDEDSAKSIQKEDKQAEIAVHRTAAYTLNHLMLNILVGQKECCKVDHSKTEDLSDKELKDLNDYMEYPVDDFKECGRIKLVRDKVSDYRSLLKRENKAVVTDDAP